MKKKQQQQQKTGGTHYLYEYLNERKTKQKRECKFLKKTKKKN